MAHKRRMPEFQAPDNHVLSEKSKLIKELTEKQLNTTVYLQEELTREKSFTKSNELISITSYTKGEKTFDSYKKFATLIDNFEELKSYGLTESEIEFLNDYNKGEDNIFSKYKNLSETALEQKLKYIYDLIEKGNKNETNNINRLVHPINNLHQINNELFGHLNTKIVVPSLKKRRKRIKKYLEETNNEAEITIINSTNTNKKTKWDVKEKEIHIKKEIYVPNNLKRVENETKDEKIIIGGKPFIGWRPNNNILSECRKISVEEIKKIDRFKNYEAGRPSKVLFIKNLSKNITEETLVNIFGHFDNKEKKITYRLLTGKMKGQAFITFNNVEQATNALETINGYIFKDKPIIIEYGKTKI